MPKKTSPASFAAISTKKPSAAPAAAPAPSTSPAASETTKNLHVRVDVDRWIRLRTYAMHNGTTVQDLLVAAIDDLIDPSRIAK